MLVLTMSIVLIVPIIHEPTNLKIILKTNHDLHC